MNIRVRCHDCGNQTIFTLKGWRCDCGSAWELAFLPSFNFESVIHEDYSIWRYKKLLGLNRQLPLKELGTGWTPLIKTSIEDHDIWFKLEFLSPSASFKDRGISIMVNQLALMGAKTLVEDSSGNAGASLAANAACLSLKAKIFVPDYASMAKRHQIAIYGAQVIPIQGPRVEAEKAAQQAASGHQVYASHAYNPVYLAGQITAAYEIWEQLGKTAPNWIICPVAQGGQFLGHWFGFKQLFQAGLIERLPRLVAVQSERIAPIYHAWRKGMDHIPAVKATGTTVAEGVAIEKPVRDKRLLQALGETDGCVLAISEEEILSAQQKISAIGYYIEPTSALAMAGWYKLYKKIDRRDTVVVLLTGSGLKGAPNHSE